MQPYTSASAVGGLPLPPELTYGEFGSGRFYERYSPFTWNWTWRRSVLFGAIAIPSGAVLGPIHGLYVHDFAAGLAVGSRLALAMLLMVAFGPSLAVLVRRTHWPLRAERTGVVMAVVAGVVLSLFVRILGNDYHDHLMGRGLTALPRVMRLFTGEWPADSFVENLATLLGNAAVHALGGGVLALRPYFEEPRRLREYTERLEMETLRRQKLATDARLAVLQAQVEPHFLFNTLASASAGIEADPQRARNLIEALAAYLRSTLPRLRPDDVVARSTLAEQFGICGRYLEVMALRLDGRLNVTVRLPKALRGLAFPPLLLISLVENAVTHGVENRAGVAHVLLSARRHAPHGTELLEVQVRDDGIGLREGLVEGTGIANVRAQLSTLYGLAARLSIESPPEGGVRATITVPLAALQS